MQLRLTVIRLILLAMVENAFEFNVACQQNILFENKNTTYVRHAYNNTDLIFKKYSLPKLLWQTTATSSSDVEEFFLYSFHHIFSLHISCNICMAYRIFYGLSSYEFGIHV